MNNDQIFMFDDAPKVRNPRRSAPLRAARIAPSHLEQLTESKAAKVAGITKVDAAAVEAWTRAMLDIVKGVCERMDQFTADDVFERLEAIPQANRPVTRDNRAFGPVMIKAAKRGWCIKADLPAVMSRRKTLHNSPIQIWQSLIRPGTPTYSHLLSDAVA